MIDCNKKEDHKKCRQARIDECLGKDPNKMCEARKALETRWAYDVRPPLGTFSDQIDWAIGEIRRLRQLEKLGREVPRPSLRCRHRVQNKRRPVQVQRRREVSNEFENAIKVLREKANVAAYDGQASMRVPLSMLLGILGRAEEWPELARLRAENAELVQALKSCVSWIEEHHQMPSYSEKIYIARAAISRAEQARAEWRQG